LSTYHSEVFRDFRRLFVDDPKVLLCLVFVPIFFVAPLALLLLICCLLVIFADHRFLWWFLAASCGLFTLLNCTKESAGDLANYIALQTYFSEIPITELFNKEVGAAITGSYRVTELGFYLPMWILARVTGNEEITIAVVATLGIYVPTFIALQRIADRENWSSELLYIVAFFAMFASINFVQTTHLLRQYIATSIVFLGFSYFLEGRRLVAASAALAGCLVHNAAAILVADIAVLAFLFPYQRRHTTTVAGRVFRFLAVMCLLGASLGLVAFLEIQEFSLDESAISLWHYAVVAVFFLTFLMFTVKDKSFRRYVHYSNLGFVLVYTLSFGFFVIGIRLFALRYLAYLEWLFGPMLGGILHVLPTERVGWFVLSRWLLVAVTVSIFVARLETAPWQYANIHAEVLGLNFFALVAAIGN
jgi:hypothetical protein